MFISSYHLLQNKTEIGKISKTGLFSKPEQITLNTHETYKQLQDTRQPLAIHREYGTTQWEQHYMKYLHLKER